MDNLNLTYRGQDNVHYYHFSQILIKCSEIPLYVPGPDNSSLSMQNTTCAVKIFLVDKIFQAIKMINTCSCTVKVNIDRFNVNVQKYQHHNSILK